MRIRALTGLAAAAILAALPAPSALAGPPERTYEVTITNLTATQFLTPPVVGTHRNAFDAFDVGAAAGAGVQQIAENGNGGPLLGELASSKHVADSLQAGGALLPGDSVTFEIGSRPGANRITFVSMLICTNDGFTGADGVKLPAQVGRSVERSFFAYDAGTEANTEDLADIVPPCQALSGVADDMGAPGTGATDPALAEGGVVHHHAGIAGGSDLLPSVHGWDTDARVSMIEVTRTA